MAMAVAPTGTLDDLLAEVLDALAGGVGPACLACGGATLVVRQRDGALSATCRTCATVLESVVQSRRVA